MATNKLSPEIVNAAIEGFEQQKLRIDSQIAELRAMLDGNRPAPAATPDAAPPKRKISAAARRRMALGQQKQWAAINRIDAQIAELRAMLDGNRPAPAATPDAAPPKRKISAAARRRMALGQQKQWAAIKGTTGSPSHATTPEPSKPKRKLSAAGRAAIVAALKKRWAAKKAAKKTAPAVSRKAIVKTSAARKAANKTPAKASAGTQTATAK